MKKCIYLLAIIIAWSISSLYCMQRPSSSLINSLAAGHQALSEGKYWLGISKVDPVFELAKDLPTKAAAAALLGIAYRHVGEPHLAYYYFNFAKQYSIDFQTQEFVRQELNTIPAPGFVNQQTPVNRDGNITPELEDLLQELLKDNPKKPKPDESF